MLPTTPPRSRVPLPAQVNITWNRALAGMPVSPASTRHSKDFDLHLSEELYPDYDYPIRSQAIDELPDWALEVNPSLCSDALLNASPASVKRLGDRLMLPEYNLTFGQAGDIIASVADSTSPFGHVKPFSILHDEGLEDDSDDDDVSLDLPRTTVIDKAEYIQAVREEDATPNEDKENDDLEGSDSDDIEEEDNEEDDDASDEYVASEDDEDEDYQPYRPTRRNVSRRGRPPHRAVYLPLSPIKGGENCVVQSGNKRRRRSSSSPSPFDSKRAKASDEGSATHISATKAANRLKKHYKRDRALRKIAQGLPHRELPDGRVQCQVTDCGKLLSKGAWERHAKTHLRGFVAALCLACGRTFTRTDPLCRHLNTNHGQCIEQNLGTDEHAKSCCKPLHEYRSKKAGLEQGRGLDRLSKDELKKAVQCLAALE